MILGTGCLLETIDSFTQFADIVRIITINEVLWLLHKHNLKESALEKNIVNI